jgi:hypothetical protein
MTTTTSRQPIDLDALQARFALRVAGCLDERAEALPADVIERLRFAREQALGKARASAPAAAAQAMGGGTSALTWGGLGRRMAPLWIKVGALVPLLVLVCGLLFIQHWHILSQIDAAAEIDAALLSDDLPPAAYSDPGFSQFLSAPRE